MKHTGLTDLTPGDFDNLISAARNSDGEATSRLWRLAQPKLKSLAERKIFRAHGTFDVEDVMMIVFATLCRKLSTGQIGPLHDATHLIKHLAIMTRHAVIDLVRYENRRCRSAGMDTTRRVALESLVCRGPGPRSQATHRDAVTQLADSLGSPELRSLLIGRLDGCSHRELAKSLGCSVRTVERKMVLIRQQFLKQQSN